MSLSQKDLNALIDLTASLQGSKGRVSLAISFARQLPKLRSMKTLDEQEITADNVDSLLGVMVDTQELCETVNLLRLEKTEKDIGGVVESNE